MVKRSPLKTKRRVRPDYHPKPISGISSRVYACTTWRDQLKDDFDSFDLYSGADMVDAVVQHLLRLNAEREGYPDLPEVGTVCFVRSQRGKWFEVDLVRMSREPDEIHQANVRCLEAVDG